MMLTVFYGTAYYSYRGLIDEKELDQFQQHQKEENPWLSRAHVDERWQKCFKPEAGKGSEKTRCLKRGQKEQGQHLNLKPFAFCFMTPWKNKHSAKMREFGKKESIQPSISRG
jgi:hypothetical protein